MVSYWKTQWFRLLVAVVCLGFAIFYALQPAAETLTVETLDAMMSDMLTSIGYFFCFLIWMTISFIDFNSERIELLEKKAEKYDALCEEVHELYEANKLDREYQKRLDQKIKLLEEKLR
jgi:hypothetical protein